MAFWLFAQDQELPPSTAEAENNQETLVVPEPEQPSAEAEEEAETSGSLVLVFDFGFELVFSQDSAKAVLPGDFIRVKGSLDGSYLCKDNLLQVKQVRDGFVYTRVLWAEKDIQLGYIAERIPYPILDFETGLRMHIAWSNYYSSLGQRGDIFLETPVTLRLRSYTGDFQPFVEFSIPFASGMDILMSDLDDTFTLSSALGASYSFYFGRFSLRPLASLALWTTFESGEKIQALFSGGLIQGRVRASFALNSNLDIFADFGFERGFGDILAYYTAFVGALGVAIR